MMHLSKAAYDSAAFCDNLTAGIVIAVFVAAIIGFILLGIKSREA